MSHQFIIYACPTGELADQLSLYFEKSRSLCGPNAAHRYMPHCTLMGFFRERLSAVPLYLQALDRAYQRALRSRPSPALTVTEMAFRPTWHGLELDAPWLKRLMVDFACTATSPTRKEALRLKDWLHLSLAYEFQIDQAQTLTRLAQDLINPQAPVQWSLRFYQRHSDQTWTCHQKWSLS